MTKQNKKRGSILATFVVLKRGALLASLMELEKKGTACGRSASERGDEPRSGTLPTSPLSHASDSRQFHKKRPLSGGHFSVELEGVEPSSKQVTDVLSTCLSYG